MTILGYREYDILLFNCLGNGEIVAERLSGESVDRQQPIQFSKCFPFDQLEFLSN